MFDGKVVVAPGAIGTDASQANRNLLLSQKAAVHTRPRLEINADDVKCAHGAAIGRLDDDALFYLRSRGLGRMDSHEILVRGFAGEVVEKVPVAAVRSLAKDGLTRVRGEPEFRRMIAAPAYDLEKVRADFPILSEEVRGQRIAYLDNAASSQKPRAVLDAVDHVYETGYANIHRGVHVLSERATEHYERSRRRMAKFIGAQSRRRGDLRPWHHRGPEPGGLLARPLRAPRGGRGAPHRDGAPLEHRALADGRRPDRREGAGGAGHRPRRTRHGRFRGAAERPDPHRLGGPRLERPRHRESGGRDRPAGEGTRRLPGARRRPGRSPSQARRAGARLRLLLPLRPQDVRPLGHRGAVGEKAPARSDPSLPGRRRDDPDGQLRTHYLRRTAGEVRGGNAQHRRPGGARGGCRLPR